jgi:leader peptidase (prepilin peptidase)/N-methyltransferase
MSALLLLSDSPPLFIGVCFVLGLMVGSFLNVVIWRLPIMLERQWREECAQGLAIVEPTASGDKSAAAAALPAEAEDGSDAPAVAPPRFNLLVPRSACPSCRAPITALQNIPILSWLLLRGRCARCGATISVRYPLVEALTGVLSALVAWKFGFGWPVLAALVLTWSLIPLTFIDIDHRLLPDSLTLPLLWLGLLLSLWSPHSAGAAVPVDPRSSLIGAMAGYGSLWTVYHLFRLLTGKDGMGYGDFKLFAALGAWLGWQMLLPVILMASASGAVIGLGLIALRGHDRATPIPFGPFLAGAGWLVLMFGPQLMRGYFGLFT